MAASAMRRGYTILYIFAGATAAIRTDRVGRLAGTKE